MTPTTHLPVTILVLGLVTIEAEWSLTRGVVGLTALDPSGKAVTFQSHNSWENAEAAAEELAREAQELLEQEKAEGRNRTWLQ